jgi:hypothetical protein
MKKTIWTLGLILGVACCAGVAAGADDEAWLHIKVDEGGSGGESVRVNLPLSLVEELLPLVGANLQQGDLSFDGGKMRIHPNHVDLDLPKILKALRDAQEGEYIRVAGRDENVRVAKVADRLMIHVDEEREQVRVNLRLDLIEAMLTNEEDEIDLAALIRALRDHGEGDLVTVESEDEQIRIWVDKQATID